MGADLIEVDLVVSRDGVLIARHENELSRSTDIASRPGFAHRRTTKEVEGVEVAGWFAEDFTLAELRMLRAVERMPDLRPLNTTYDGRFGILTFAEVVELARRRSSSERRIGVLAELKHPTWSAEQGLPMAELVAAELLRLRATGPQDTIVVQSFDAAGLRDLRARTGLRGPTMLQLINDTSPVRPDDHPDRAAGDLDLRTRHRAVPPPADPARRRRRGDRRLRPRRPGAQRGPVRHPVDGARRECVPPSPPAPGRGPGRVRRRGRRGGCARGARRGRSDHRPSRHRRPRPPTRSSPRRPEAPFRQWRRHLQQSAPGVSPPRRGAGTRAPGRRGESRGSARRVDSTGADHRPR